jgi:putative aldouronate transport system substrate-binding protein
MKKTVTMLTVFLLCFTLFFGCGGNDTETVTPDNQDSPDSGAITSTAGEETSAPYQFAAGNFEVDAKGFPTGKYAYQLPISTSDETLTLWTTCWTPEWLPAGQDYKDTPFPVKLEDDTGIMIDYILVSNDDKAENFGVLLASDDLCDIMTTPAGYYNGSFKNAVTDEKYFINIYDYKEYCPNYIFEIIKDPNNSDLIDTVFEEENLITLFSELKAKGVLKGGTFTRGDWLEDFGMTADDIVTFDDLHNLLMLSKTEKGLNYPMFLYSTIELFGTNEFVAFDTYASINQSQLNQLYVQDGKVRLANMNENDKELMTMLNLWYNDGLIDPDWTSFKSNVDADEKIHQGEYNYLQSSPNGAHSMSDTLAEDDTIGWVPLKKPLRAENQTLHLGLRTSRIHYGSAAISAKCENIPLAVSWIDYRYSDAGALLCTYGVKGVTWEFDENGKPYQTEWLYNNENNHSMLLCIYALNTINDPGMLYYDGAYKYPGGEKALYALDCWMSVPYDGAYEWPVSLSSDDFTPEDRETVTTLSTDLLTYISENYPGFVDGSKPLSEWDSYINDLVDMGINEVISLYQKLYDSYLAAYSAG